MFESDSAKTEFALLDNILVSVKWPSAEHATYPRVVLPPQWRKKVINNRHEQAGHAAYQRTLYHVQQSYVWPDMCKDIEYVLARCGTCRLFNTQKPHVELERMPVAYYPHQIVSMDLVGSFPRARFGHSYLFTLIDHLTGWADASPIAHKKVVQ